MITGMAVPLPTLVYAWPKTKSDFDQIGTDETVHDWKQDQTTTLIKNDGKNWERRCHSKSISDQSTEVMVVFQWFDERPIAA